MDKNMFPKKSAYLYQFGLIFREKSLRKETKKQFSTKKSTIFLLKNYRPQKKIVKKKQENFKKTR